MKAIAFNGVGTPLQCVDMPPPQPSKEQVQVRVLACGVCRTDLHIIDGELPHPKLPLILGHQIVGVVLRDSGTFRKGDRIGIPWLGKTCGTCPFCQSKRENLCDAPELTGYSCNGGFAEVAVAHRECVFPLPTKDDPLHQAPLLCAGIIGYRSLRKAGRATRLGFYGFGAAARLVLQVALHENRQVFAFTRPGDEKGQQEALKLGAIWAGSSEEMPPKKLQAALIFAPVGDLVPLALKALEKGGKVICAGIHMSDIPPFPYHLLWHERKIESVAHLTRSDGEAFLKLAADIPIETQVVPYPLEGASQACDDLRAGKVSGTAVLLPCGAR